MHRNLSWLYLSSEFEKFPGIHARIDNHLYLAALYIWTAAGRRGTLAKSYPLPRSSQSGKACTCAVDCQPGQKSSTGNFRPQFPAPTDHHQKNHHHHACSRRHPPQPRPATSYRPQHIHNTQTLQCHSEERLAAAEAVSAVVEVRFSQWKRKIRKYPLSIMCVRARQSHTC